MSQKEHLKITERLRKVGEVEMVAAQEVSELEITLLVMNIVLILIRLHVLEKKVKKLEETVK